MIAEVLIFVPSVANYRNVWLLNKLDTAEVASIVFLDSSDPMLSETAQAQLLESTGALAVAVRAGPVSTMMATSSMPPEIDRHIDMAVMGPLESITSALSLMLSGTGHVYRVTGKMKSREGTVVDADDLILEITEEAEMITKAQGKLDDFDSDEAKELYHQLGMGALKYFILKVDPKKRMLFNPAESIDLNGNTGPFIQYTHARIKSILRKYTNHIT